MWVHKFFWCFGILQVCSQQWNHWVKGSFTFSFLRKFHTVFHSGYTVCIPTNSAVGFFLQREVPVSHGAPSISPRAHLQWTTVQLKKGEIKSLLMFLLASSSHCLHFITISTSISDSPEMSFSLQICNSRKKKGNGSRGGE